MEAVTARSRLRRPGDPRALPCALAAAIPAFALSDQAPLELRHRAQHLQHENAAGAGGVDGIAERAEMRPARAQRLDDLQQVRQRAGQPVDPRDQQGVALPRGGEGMRELRAGARCPTGMLLEDAAASGRFQPVALRAEVLISGRHTRVADQGLFQINQVICRVKDGTTEWS